MKFQGKSVLITGGTGALGHVVAESFLREGASVSTSYIFEDELKRLKDNFKKNVFIVRTDVTHDEDVAALFRQVSHKSGKVDILINLVGGFLPKTNIQETKSKDWDQMFD